MIGDLLFLIALALLAQSLGGCCWRLIAGVWPGGWQWTGLALPLGLGWIGLTLGLFASLGLFFTGLYFSILVASLATAYCIFTNWQVLPKLNKLVVANSWIDNQLLIWCALIFMAWLGLHSPVTDGDALCYHLEVAKRMAQTGSVAFDPDLHETAYPLLVESLQAGALLLRGPVATRAISFLFGLSFSASAVLLARPLIGSKNAIWAGIILLSVPIVNCGMIAPLNDVPLAAFCTSALVALGDESFDRKRRIIACGLFCGLACGVKFPGIVWSGVMGLVICMQALQMHFKLRTRKTEWLSLPLLFCAILIASGGFWYVRAAMLTGNPVHPYFKNTFGGHGLDEVLEDARKTPLEHVWNIATAPVGLALVPGRYDSFSHQIGPLFLALVPLGFLSRQPRSWYFLLGIGWLEMAICLTQRQSPRFYIATLAPWSAAAATVLVQWLPSIQKEGRNNSWRIIAFASVSLVVLNLSFNLGRVRHSSAILAGILSPSKFLMNQEPTARLAGWIDYNLPADARLIGQDHRGFYWPRPFTMEKAHRRRTGLLKNAAGPEVVIVRLKNAGFTHLVMAEPDPIDAVEFDQDLSIYLNSWLADRTPLLDQTIHEPDGYNRRYRIYELKPGDATIPAAKFADDRPKTDPFFIPAGAEKMP